MSGINDFHSIFKAIQQASQEERKFSREEAERLLRKLFQSCVGGEHSDLSNLKAFYEERGDFVTFAPAALAKLTERISHIADVGGNSGAAAPPAAGGAGALAPPNLSDNASLMTGEIIRMPGKTLSYLKPKERDFPPGVSPQVRELAFSPIPLPFPLDKDQFRRGKQELIESAQNDFDRRVISKALEGIRHLTFNDLTQELQRCIERFNSSIGVENYKTFVMRNKSNWWVSQLALNLGIKPPIGLIENRFENPESQKIVILDDCSYSGSQIVDNMNLLSTAAGKPQGLKFFVVVPFITNGAKKFIQEFALKHSLNVELITNSFLPSLAEVLDPDEMRRFKELFCRQEGSSGSALAFADWKLPDYLSVPEYFFSGRFNLKIYADTEHYAKKRTSRPLVPVVVPPYKPEAKLL